MRKQLSLLGTAGLALVISIATAATPNTVNVRGTIERTEGPVYVVKTRNGADLRLALADNAQVTDIINASLGDIKQGSFVGVTAIPQTDGSQRAVEVHIFPEAMRGTGEGNRRWDLAPTSTMTNANVQQAVTAVDGRTLTLKYKGDEKIIVVPNAAPIVTFVPGDRSDLKPGAKIFAVAATKQPDGTFLAPRISVGKNGLTPPM